MKRVLMVLAVAALAVAACGDDDGGGGDKSAATAKVKASLMDESTDGFGLSEDDADCIAEKIVDDFGAERVDEIDFTASTPAFEGDEPAQAADAFDDCMELNKLMTSLITSDASVSDDSKACLDDSIDEDDAHTFLEESLSATGDGPSQESLDKLDEDLSSCLTAEEYAALS
jgi:hypothetical protein